MQEESKRRDKYRRRSEVKERRKELKEEEMLRMEVTEESRTMSEEMTQRYRNRVGEKRMGKYKKAGIRRKNNDQEMRSAASASTELHSVTRHTRKILS